MNLKQKLCEFLLNNNLVKENDVIKHSYSNKRLSEWNKRNVEFNNISPTLDTRCDCLGVVVKEKNMNNLRIRKLTPTECFRLMGVKDEDSGKLNHLSNSVKYHLAGDSIVVNVLEAIFKSILIDNPVVDKKPIRLIEFFAGYGSQALALKYLGIPFEHYVTCEWAIKSIDAYKHIHFPNVNEDYTDLMDKDDLVDFLYEKGISSNWNEPMTREQIARKNENELRQIYNNCAITKNLINIQQVHGQDLKITERERFNYILTYSFPCVTKNTLVLTERGYIPFKDVFIGEKVLTKSNTWQQVIKQFDNGITDVYLLKGFGTAGIECTKEHKFYVREMYRKGHKSIRYFKEPKMKHAKDLVTSKDYLGIPVIKEERPFYTDDVNFWYLIGMYLGDGWLNKTSKDIRFCLNDVKIEKFSKLGYQYSMYDNGFNCKTLRINDKDVYAFIEKYIGTVSDRKHIPIEILNLPRKQLQALYDGYLATDGCVIGNKHQFSSINESMSYSLVSIIHKLYNKPAYIYKINTKPKKVIQGREVNQKNWYQVRFKLNNSKQDKAFYENGYIWFPFKSLTYLRKDNVYNMEIENDHSYIINGVISANCQDLSLAGKGAGMEKGSGTRSGMLWEVERILDELGEELPQILLMENVPQVVGKKNKEHFDKWVYFLESKGYTNKYCMLNAKEVGYSEPVPQNRNRCFMISVLNPKCDIVFPEKTERIMVLKDVLEENVDEKYYLSEKQVDSIRNSTFVTNKNRIQEKDYCQTLCARDWKDPKCAAVNRLGGIFDTEESTHQAVSVYDIDGISPTLSTMQGGYRQPCVAEIRRDEGIRLFKDNCCGSLRTIDSCGDKVILIKNNTKQGYLEACDGDCVNISSRMKNQRGNVQKGITQTITTSGGNERGVVLEEKWADLD